MYKARKLSKANGAYMKDCLLIQIKHYTYPNKFNRISETFTSHVSKFKIYELFSGFSEVKMSLKSVVSTSFTSPLQVVKKLSKWQIVYLTKNL